MFDKMKQLGGQGAAVAKMAMLQNKIKAKKITYEEGDYKVVMTGDMKIKRVEINGEEQKELLKVVNSAIEKTERYVKEELQGSMGDLSKLLGGMGK